MNKKELLNALRAKFYKVLGPVKQRDEAGIAWYLVGTYDRKGDAMVRNNISFYVEGAGEDETAYWSGGEPKPTPAPPAPFTAEVNRYIADKIDDGTLADGVVERVNEATETATVRALMSAADAIGEHRLLVSRDAEGNLQYDKIGVSA